MSTYRPRLHAHDLSRALPVIEAGQRYQSMQPGPKKRLALECYHDAQRTALGAGLYPPTLVALVHDLAMHQFDRNRCRCMSCKPGQGAML
jgi:hypothetical protein